MVAGWGHPTWNACKLMASMTDISTNEPKVFACCQQEFINRHVCICSRLSIHPSLSAPLCITEAVCCHSADWLWGNIAAEAWICNPSTLGRGFITTGESFYDHIDISPDPNLTCFGHWNRFMPFVSQLRTLAPCRKHTNRHYRRMHAVLGLFH